jgi:hypothetical protein
MRESIKKIGEYILLGLFVLGFIIAYGVSRSRNFNLYFFSVGVILILIPIAVLAIVTWMDNRHAPRKRETEDLKLTGVKIPVDLTKCKVKSNSWTKEVARYENHPRVAFLNEVSGHSDKNVERIASHVSLIEYTCRFNGKRKRFVSSGIPKDRTTMLLLMEMQQQTTIYVDRDNDKIYYFDVDFLNG